jgi:phenylalanyl-tRNA synthetase alpha chain
LNPDILTEITSARDAALAEIASASTPDAVASMTTRFAGKKGELAGLKKRLGSLDSIDEKKAAGAAINEAMAAVDAALDEQRSALNAAALAAQVETERLDLTEYVGKPTRGKAHLVTQAWERLEDVFVGLGFQVAEGPEVETDWHNFEALNMGEGHPARGEFDTLFVDHVPPGGAPGSTVLRTHTSPVQIRTMLEKEPPIYIVAPGRVFRRDTPDATHMPVFHQIEGLVIDRNISMADLAGTIQAFTTAFFGKDWNSRLRPDYFPFTEPSAEFDIQRPDGSWIELGGCGMVHPNVLRAGGIDPEEWSGFAFGFGIDRMALMRHGVDDLRAMYADDLRFTSQF